MNIKKENPNENVKNQTLGEKINKVLYSRSTLFTLLGACIALTDTLYVSPPNAPSGYEVMHRINNSKVFIDHNFAGREFMRIISNDTTYNLEKNIGEMVEYADIEVSGKTLASYTLQDPRNIFVLAKFDSIYNYNIAQIEAEK